MTATHPVMPARAPSPANAAKLRERIHDLEDALRARDEFIATLGHELRNPLSPIFLQVAFMIEQVKAARDGVVTADWLLPKLDGFSKRLERLLEVLNRLMDVSKIGDGHLAVYPERVDLSQTVREICVAHEREITAARCALAIDAEDDVVGNWDRMRVEQIFTNLLSNALRYGAGRPVSVTVRAHENEATLSVRDQGIGIAKADLTRIFERFERGGRASPRTGSFGLGLWITRKLCEAMGGRITVESELGHGSDFRVSLPLGAESQS